MGKFGPKKTKLFILSQNWHTWYLRNPDSYSNISFLKFRPQNSFLGKFGTKKLKLSVLSKIWHTWDLEDADFFFSISFLNFQPKNYFFGKFGPKQSKLSVFSENWYTWYLMEADSYSNSSFLNFKLKIHFGQIWDKKVKFLRFVWKLIHMVSRGFWFFFQLLFSEFQTKNQILAKKVKFVNFA